MDRYCLSHIETSALISFIEVAERGSFTDAALALNLSQPTVSQQIQRLERFVGAKLFHRRSNKVCLSLAGEAFIPYCQTGLQNIEAGVVLAQKASQRHTSRVTLGLTCFNTQRFLSDVLNKFHKRYPNVYLEILEDLPENLLLGLQRQTIDLALLSLPIPMEAFHVEELYEEPLYFIVPETHSLATAKEIAWKDIVHQPIILPQQNPSYGIRAVVEEFFRNHQSKLNTVAEFSGYQSLRKLLLSNFGIAFLPFSLVESEFQCGLVAVKLSAELSLTHKVIIANNSKYSLTSEAKDFLEMAQQAAMKLSSFLES